MELVEEGGAAAGAKVGGIAPVGRQRRQSLAGRRDRGEVLCSGAHIADGVTDGVVGGGAAQALLGDTPRVPAGRQKGRFLMWRKRPNKK